MIFDEWLVLPAQKNTCIQCFYAPYIMCWALEISVLLFYDILGQIWEENNGCILFCTSRRRCHKLANVMAFSGGVQKDIAMCKCSARCGKECNHVIDVINNLCLRVIGFEQQGLQNHQTKQLTITQKKDMQLRTCRIDSCHISLITVNNSIAVNYRKRHLDT